MKNKRSLFALPYVVWMAFFVVAPILLVVFYAFTSAAGDPTLDNFRNMGDYLVVFGRSFELAVIATLVCLIIGYPISYWMAKEGPRFQRIAMVLIMLPMWMNFLLRTYAWMSILENTGLLNRLFAAVGIIDLGNLINGGLNSLCAALNGAFGLSLDTTRDTAMTYFQMINTSGAVVLGMVYNYLPFMILPIYSVLVKMDNSLLEAARDLGADSGGCPGSGRRLRHHLPAGDLSPESPRHPLRGDHGVCALGVHLCHLPAAGGQQQDAAGQPDRNAVYRHHL